MKDVSVEPYSALPPTYAARLVAPRGWAYIDAVRWILGHEPGAGAADPVPVFLENLGRRGLDADLVSVATRGDRRVSACMAVVSPGASALLLAPQQDAAEAPPGATRAAIGELIHALGPRAIRLVQALVPPDHPCLPRVFRDGGFTFLTQLLYLELVVSDGRAGAPPIDGRDWRQYAPDTHALFVDAVEASYVNSGDCPALAGLRATEDVLAGHRCAGDSGTRHWWVLLDAGRPVGVLLLAYQERARSCEVVYMGVAARARRRGRGATLLAMAEHQARRLGARTLTLAVDRANQPARRLYARWGFQRIGRRDAWISVLETARR